MLGEGTVTNTLVIPGHCISRVDLDGTFKVGNRLIMSAERTEAVALVIPSKCVLWVHLPKWSFIPLTDETWPKGRVQQGAWGGECVSGIAGVGEKSRSHILNSLQPAIIEYIGNTNLISTSLFWIAICQELIAQEAVANLGS